MKNKQKDMPLIALPYAKKDISINGELMVDYDTGDYYVNDGGKISKSIVENILNRLSGEETPSIVDEKHGFQLKINMADSDPEAATYDADCTGFKPSSFDTAFDYGSWKDIIDYLIGGTPVLMEDGEEICNLDPNNYDKALDIAIKKRTIYGFDIDMSSGEVTYTNEAVGLTPINIKEEIKGDFKLVLRDFLGIKVTALDPEGNSNYDVDPNHPTLKLSQSSINSDDNIMVRFKKNYYYYRITDDGSTFEFRVSNYRANPALYSTDIFGDTDHFYIGAYDPAKINDKIVSKSGTAPYFDTFIGDELFEKRYMYILCIAIMISKSTSLSGLGYEQTKVYSSNPGDMDDEKMISANDKGIKVFGAENLFGNGSYFSNSLYADNSELTMVIDSSLLDEDNSIDCTCLTLRDNNLLKSRSDSSYKNITGINGSIININIPNKLFV